MSKLNLEGSVGKAYDSLFWGHEFELCVGYRDYLEKKKRPNSETDLLNRERKEKHFIFFL